MLVWSVYRDVTRFWSSDDLYAAALMASSYIMETTDPMLMHKLRAVATSIRDCKHSSDTHAALEAITLIGAYNTVAC